MALSDSQKTCILTIRLICSFFSMLGTLFVISSSLYFKQFKGMSSRLILYLMTASAGTSIVNIFSLGLGTDPKKDPLCIAQGVMLQFFQQSEFLWVCIIAVHLFVGLVLHKRPKRKYEIVYHCVVWGMASVFMVLPGTTRFVQGLYSFNIFRDYGPAGVWCWISADTTATGSGSGDNVDRSDTGYIWRLIAFYIPLFAYIIFEVVIYVLVFKEAKKIFVKISFRDLISSSKSTPGLAILRRLAVYPIIFILVWIFPIVNRFQNWIHPNDEIFALYLLQVLTAPLFGFWNSVFYTFDIALGSRYRNALRQHGCCLKCVGTSEENVEADDYADNFVDEMDTAAVGAAASLPAPAYAKSTVVPPIQ